MLITSSCNNSISNLNLVAIFPLEMARSSMNPITLLLLLTFTIGAVSPARVLDELDPSSPIAAPLGSPEDFAAVPSPLETPPSAFPSGQLPATLAPAEQPVPENISPQPQPIVTVSPPAPLTTTTSPANIPSASPVTTGQTGSPSSPVLSFFMHDILGGTHASGRVVTGIVATSAASNIPFSKPNTQVLPVNNGGSPLFSGNINNIVNNRNVPFLTGLNGQQTSTNSIVQNAGTNSAVNGGNNNQAFVSIGQLPQGATLEKLMFGSITVIDDQLTETQDLGSAVLGEAQGFYLASSLDGQSHTMAWTAIFHGSDHQDITDMISFFGVHRTAAPESQVVVIGGTGKYENAKGYATIVTLPQVDQHTTDGVDTIVQVNVYLYY